MAGSARSATGEQHRAHHRERAGFRDWDQGDDQPFLLVRAQQHRARGSIAGEGDIAVGGVNRSRAEQLNQHMLRDPNHASGPWLTL